MRKRLKIEINDVDVSYYLTNWKPYFKWLRDDIHLYLEKAVPRWKTEFRYFDALLRQGYSLMDVHNMRADEYAELRKKLPFIYRANARIDVDKAEKDLRGDWKNASSRSK